MNVVLLPALASLATAGADAFPCMSGTCLFGWLWLTAALTLLSVWAVRDWQQSGGNDKAVLGRRLVPVASAVRTATAPALMPRPSDVAPRARASSSPPSASLSRNPSGLVPVADAASLALRDSSTTDMAAAPPLLTSRNHSAGRSFPPRRPVSRSPGTPTVPDPSGPSGQNPPA